MSLEMPKNALLDTIFSGESLHSMTENDFSMI
jgi:hypothetical protein